MESQHNESEFIRHLECENCGSTDANSMYTDGHQFCFACDNLVPSNDDELPRKPAGQKEDVDFLEGEFKGIPRRKITEETCRKFGYHVAKRRGRTYQVANYRNTDRMLVAQKLRDSKKEFSTIGSMGSKPLFGMHLWSSGRKLVITEGEIDCLTVSQVQGNKYPTVSIPTGSKAAKKVLQANMEYLSNFDEIILFFDQDEAGREAAKECAPLFAYGRVKIVSFHHKDANEALVAGDEGSIISAIFNAKPHKPDGIFTGLEVLESEEEDLEQGVSWPYESLTVATYGKRVHEMYALAAGTGCGKTDMLKEDVAHNIAVHGEMCGTIFLEETKLKRTLNSIAGKVASEIYHVPGKEVDEEKKAKTLKLVADKLLMYKAGGDSEPEDILQIIRDLVMMGCKHIYLDHVTYVMDGCTEENGVAALKKFMRQLNDLNKELPFILY